MLCDPCLRLFSGPRERSSNPGDGIRERWWTHITLGEVLQNAKHQRCHCCVILAQAYRTPLDVVASYSGPFSVYEVLDSAVIEYNVDVKAFERLVYTFRVPRKVETEQNISRGPLFYVERTFHAVPLDQGKPLHLHPSAA